MRDQAAFLAFLCLVLLGATGALLAVDAIVTPGDQIAQSAGGGFLCGLGFFGAFLVATS